MRVLLSTNEPVLTLGVQCVLAPAGFELEVVSGTKQKVLHAVGLNCPDVLLFDFQTEQSFATLIALRTAYPNCKVVLWVYDISVEVSYQAMKLGVRGIVRKTHTANLLIDCLECVAADQCWFDQESRAQFFQARMVALTPRETELVILISQGLKNKEVAATLDISEATVRIYLSSLFKKLCVKDRYELAIYGLRHIIAGARSAAGEPATKKLDHRAVMPFLLMERPIETAAASASGERKLKKAGGGFAFSG